MAAVVNIDSVSAYYTLGAYGSQKTIRAVEGVDLQIHENEILGIAGESGCGKTTFLKVLSGMVKPPLRVVNGSVVYSVNGKPHDVYGQGDEPVRLGWDGVSYIPQGSMSVLNPVRRVAKTFEDFVQANMDHVSEAEYQRLVKDQLFTLGLPEEVLMAYPHQLSGGMRQRVVIAVATILKPKVMYADEPSSALDVVAQRGVIQMLKKIQKDMHNTMVLVSHDMGVHANLTDRIAIMYAGKLVEVGKTTDIFDDPQHPYTKFLIGSLPRVGDKSYRVSAPGSPPPLDDPPQGCRFHPRCPHAMDICKTVIPTLKQVSENGQNAACHWVDQQLGLAPAGGAADSAQRSEGNDA